MIIRGAAKECQYLNQLEEDSKVIFLTETKCKIRFIYVGFNNKRKKSGVKKNLEICAIKGGGVGPLMANAILNFHFDFLTPSLIQ